jgi:hypothetical protein
MYAATVLNIAIEVLSEIASGKRDEWREESREKALRKVKGLMTYQAKVSKETKRAAARIQGEPLRLAPIPRLHLAR